jgi:hypothetical protein
MDYCLKCWWFQLAAARGLYLIGVAVVIAGIMEGSVLVTFAGGVGALLGELRTMQLVEVRNAADGDARSAMAAAAWEQHREGR